MANINNYYTSNFSQEKDNDTFVNRENDHKDPFILRNGHIEPMFVKIEGMCNYFKK